MDEDKPPPYDQVKHNTQYELFKKEEIDPNRFPTPSHLLSSPINTTVYNIHPKRIFSRQPTSIVCVYCNSNVVTQPRAEIGAGTWLSSGFMILLGLWCGCCLIPFYFDEFKDVYHDCPNCRRTIDVVKPL